MKDTEIDYLWLFVVIVFGVTCGNLLSNWITASYAAYQVEQAAHQFSRTLEQQTAKSAAEREEVQARQAAQQRQQQQQMRALRETSKVALDLRRQCDDWRRADTENATATTHAQAQKFCRQYDQYLDTGVWDPGH